MRRPTVLAILPARGGSKRIPGKNVKEFCGKPMIAWPIQTLQSCGLISDIIVSTDSPEIQEVVKSLNVKAPFLRPPELSDDTTGTSVVIKHAVEWYIENISTKLTTIGAVYLTLVCLMPEFLIANYPIPFYLGGASILIVVVVAIDTVTQIQTRLMSSQYEQLIKKTKFGR